MASACKRLSRHGLQATLTLLLLCAAVMPVSADRWYEDYEQAVALIESQGCSSEAIELLGAAATDKKKPKAPARITAVRTIDYLPYYQLARAHLACNHLDQAAEYLERSRSYGVAAAEQLAIIERELQRARAAQQEQAIDPAQLSSAISDAEQRIDRCDALRAELQALWSDPVVTTLLQEDESGLADRRRRAEQTLERARTGLVEARDQDDATAVMAVSDARVQAIEAVTGLETLLAELRSGRDEALRRRQERRTPTRIAAMASPTQAAGRPTPTAAAPPAPTPAVASSTPPAPASATPGSIPEPLRRAAEQYFKAEYQAALTTLQELPTSTDRVLAVALLLRAAARHALLRVSDDSAAQPDSLADIEADIAECHRLDADVRPTAELFPPHFLTLFERAAGTS